MHANTKPLSHAIESATLRLDAIVRDPLGHDLIVGHEIGCLYRLLLEVANAVHELQGQHNESR